MSLIQVTLNWMLDPDNSNFSSVFSDFLGSFLGSDAALKSRGNLCFFEDVGVEGFFAF
jgi:hypothetical protein